MDQAERVRERIDIVALIQEYIPLKKTGRNFKANCPFHNESTPSFVVSPERQIWHCFGCSKGGDCFTFVMEYDHVEFPEALRILADKAGIVLEQSTFTKNLFSKREHIVSMNQIAADFYHFLLTKHPVGKQAFQYLTEKRKILPQTIETFHLGFAPMEDALGTYLMKKKKYTKDDIFQAGLGYPFGKGIGDFFRNRIMFPIRDQRGSIVGFSGRVFTKDAKQAKYINTKETPAYHKGSIFYGLFNAKEEIKKENRVIVMEGEFDVLSSFQEGVTNVVAVKGTAFTPDQVQLIARFCQKVSLCFDTDKAGLEALKRSVPLLEKKGLQVGVVRFFDGKDADEVIKHNPVVFKKAVAKDVNVYEFLIEQAVEKYGNRTIEGKRSMSDEILPFLAGVENEIVKEHFMQRLSVLLGVSNEVLQREMERMHKKEVVKKDVSTAAVPKKRIDMLEEYAVALLVQAHDTRQLMLTHEQSLILYPFQTPAYQKILDLLWKYIKTHDTFVVKDFLTLLPQELAFAFDTCFLLPLAKFADEEKYTEEVLRVLNELYSMHVKEEIQHITQEIKEKEKSGEEDGLVALQEQLSHYISLLPKT